MTHELDSLPRKGGLPGDYVLLVGQSPTPADRRPSPLPGPLAVEICMDPADLTAIRVDCRELTPSAVNLLREVIEGRCLESALPESERSLRRRYFGPNKSALLQALEDTRRQFSWWSGGEGASTSCSADTERGANPLDATGSAEEAYSTDGPNGPQRPTGIGRPDQANGPQGGVVLEASTPAAGVAEMPQEPPAPAEGLAGPVPHSEKAARGRTNNSHHSLATLLVALLAHSRLLDGKGWQQLGAPLSTETRRHAIQLYAVVQQILHSVEAEPGLLQPQIEPMELGALVDRALRRSTLPRRQVNVDSHLPPDLTPARGDRVVLEEALVMLFDEIGSYAESDEASLEITAGKRRMDILLTIELRDRRGSPGETGDEEQPPPTLLEKMWKCGLGTLAARALVEHQGGRLWMQESFPKDLPSLCLSLPAHQIQDDTDPTSSEDEAGATLVPTRQKRISALWR